IATFIMLFFTESMFAYIGTLTSAAVVAGRAAWLASPTTKLLQGFYYVAPSYSPFAEQTALVQRTLRVTAIDWQYLAGGYMYALLACVFGYVLTVTILRRQSLV